MRLYTWGMLALFCVFVLLLAGLLDAATESAQRAAMAHVFVPTVILDPSQVVDLR